MVYTVSVESDEPIYISPILENVSVVSENGVVSICGYSDNTSKHSATLQVYTLGWDFASLTNDMRNEDYIIVHQDETIVSDELLSLICLKLTVPIQYTRYLYMTEIRSMRSI